MRQAVLIGVSVLVLALLMPVILLTPMPQQTEDFVLVVHASSKPNEAENMVRIGTEQGILELPLETYLIGVVLSEMPASFELEALKAQAVASRTFTLHQMQSGKHASFNLCAVSSCCQAWSEPETLRMRWGDDFSSYWEKGEQAVTSTKGEVLHYDGGLIEAVYFSSSGGMTEAAAAVWGTEVPYLQPVASPGEESSKKYETSVTVSMDEFRTLLREHHPTIQLDGSAFNWFGSVDYTDGGGVAWMEIGAQRISGRELRTIFGLNSTRFQIEIEADAITFRVSGNGHRVGMSQYGANAMAQNGKTYDQILKHYYTGVEIKQN